MHLLNSEIMTVDAVLDWALTWVDSLHDDAGLELHDIDPADSDDAFPHRGTSAWYEPRLPELRQALAGC